MTTIETICDLPAAKTRYLTIDDSEFETRFRPVPNHLDLHASFDYGCGGCLFGTSSKEFKYILAQNPRCIWTVLDGDNGEVVLGSGLHIVNRIGYIVTTVLVEPGTAYTVILD